MSASFGLSVATLLLAAMLGATPAAALKAPAEPLPPRKPLPAANILLTLDWDDLLPESELTAAFQDIAPRHDYLGEGGPGARQAGSIAVRRELDNRKAKVPGFVVPFSITSEGLIHDAFLVPYFGACIHVPPPPPNQIIYLHSDAGFRVKTIYEPYWATGVLSVKSKDTRLGVAAYTLAMQKLERYE
jgi:uncharacterized protein